MHENDGDDVTKEIADRDLAAGLVFVVIVTAVAIFVVLWLAVPGLFTPCCTRPAS
ncbi:MAG: hypothetical protein ACYC65_09835 [Candidatus Limnocylindrales bacterium]|jgi:hypothetical protein